MNTEAIVTALTAKHTEQRTKTHSYDVNHNYPNLHHSLGAELAYHQIILHIEQHPDIERDTLTAHIQDEALSAQTHSDACEDSDSRQHWSGFADAYAECVQIINETELKPA